MLLLHFPCVAIVRNGIQICKFVVFHHEEFSNPVEVFLLGFLVLSANILCEYTNALCTMSQTSVTGVISKFVGFKVMIQIQDYYLRQRNNFRVKQAVSEPLKINSCESRIYGSKAFEKKGRNSSSEDLSHSHD